MNARFVGMFNVMTHAAKTQGRGEQASSATGLIDVPTGVAARSQAVIRLGGVMRVALMLTPQRGGSLAEEVAEVLAAMQDLQRRHEWPLWLTAQTVFLRQASDRAECERLFSAAAAHIPAVTHYAVQSPASGARLAVEAWAIGGPGVTVDRLSPQAVVVAYDGLRWCHTGNVNPSANSAAVYAEAGDVFRQSGELLARAGMAWPNVVRTWWYLSGITDPEGKTQRYMEMNRARADAFAGLQFGNHHLQVAPGHSGFPASTGIGMTAGTGLSLATLALKTDRREVTLLPLENPLQTPAYDYAARYSPVSPKFARAMTLVLPDYLTTWISGTASITHSEVRHPGDIVGQTEQTLDNIAALIAPENFARHGLPDTRASLRDLAKVRVYVKRAADYAACRAVCEQRLGNLPAVYVIADVCRPELLVEIEGVAFSRRSTGAS